MLSERLRIICDFLDDATLLVDVGTDHAYVPITCIENEKVVKAIASDVNAGPIMVANRNIAEHGLEDRIQTIVTDGLSGIADAICGNADALIIAGMGGTLICEILERAIQSNPDQLKCFEQIILQPMKDISDLRTWLFANGFLFVDEQLAEESDNVYYMVKVRFMGESNEQARITVPPECAIQDLLDVLVGPMVKNRRDRVAKRFFERVLARRQKVTAGLEKSRDANAKLSVQNSMLYEKALQECKALTALLNDF